MWSVSSSIATDNTSFSLSVTLAVERDRGASRLAVLWSRAARNLIRKLRCTAHARLTRPNQTVFTSRYDAVSWMRDRWGGSEITAVCDEDVCSLIRFAKNRIDQALFDRRMFECHLMNSVVTRTASGIPRRLAWNLVPRRTLLRVV